MTNIELHIGKSGTINQESMHDRPVQKRKRILPYLDGVRALAALWVLLGHAWTISHGGFHSVSGLKGLCINWLGYPHLAVDIFIVLSGFCLGIPIEGNNGFIPGGAIAFYKKRAHRILPPLFAAMVIATAFLLLGRHIGAGADAAVPISIKLFLANFLILQDLVGKYNILDPVMWTVALEYKIYFLLPLFALLMRRFNMPVMLVIAGLIGFGSTVLIHAIEPTNNLIRTCPWFVLLFSFGVAGSQFIDSETKSWGVLTLIGLIATYSVLRIFAVGHLGEDHGAFVSYLPLIDCVVGFFAASTLTLLAILSSLPTQPLVLRLLGSRPLVFVGGFSYSIYLVHYPLLEVLFFLSRHFLHTRYQTFNPLVFFTAISAALFCAYLFFLFCERPFMNVKPRTQLK